jgi:drug/metabolite transporter (DMT)-like permease
VRAASIIATARGSRSEAFGPAEWGLLGAIALMWGSSFLLIAIGLEGFEPGLIALLRLVFGAVALSLVPRARRPVDREDLPRILVLGVVWMAVPLTLFPVAQQWIDSSRAGMINGAMPLFSALVAAILLRAAPGIRQALGLLVGFSGVVLVTLPAAEGASAQTLGLVLALMATMLYGLAANLTVPLQQKYGALPVVWRAQLVATVLVLPYGLMSLPGSSFRLGSLLAIAVLGLLATGLAYVLMAILVGRAGATRGAVAIYFIPVVATFLGVVFRHETVGPLALGGVALILLGAWLTSRREGVPRPPRARASHRSR